MAIATSTCAQGGNVLKAIETPQGAITIREICIGRRSCACPGAWEELVSFVAASLTEETARLRYCAVCDNVRAREEKNKAGYWKVLGAFVDEQLVGACFVEVNRVRHRGVYLLDTETVELAYVVHPDFRKRGIAPALTTAACELCARAYIGTHAKICALTTNNAMRGTMKKFGTLKGDQDFVTVSIPLRSTSSLDLCVDCACVALGTYSYMALLPVRRMQETLTRLAA